jgi:hypothetical protein
MSTLGERASTVPWVWVVQVINILLPLLKTMIKSFSLGQVPIILLLSIVMGSSSLSVSESLVNLDTVRTRITLLLSSFQKSMRSQSR